MQSKFLSANFTTQSTPTTSGFSPDTPALSKETLDTILAEAQRRGYDTSKLIWVKQK